MIFTEEDYLSEQQLNAEKRYTRIDGKIHMKLNITISKGIYEGTPVFFALELPLQDIIKWLKNMITIDLLKNHPHAIPALAHIWHDVLGKIWMPEIGLEEIESLYHEELKHDIPIT